MPGVCRSGGGSFQLKGLKEEVGEPIDKSNLESIRTTTFVSSTLMSGEVELSAELTNPCAWGFVNQDDYENRGWYEMSLHTRTGTLARMRVRAALNGG